MAEVTVKCPNCGKIVEVETTGGAECPVCGYEFDDEF